MKKAEIHTEKGVMKVEFYEKDAPNTAHLDRNHTCFGKVMEGVDVVDDIAQGDKIEKVVVTEE